MATPIGSPPTPVGLMAACGSSPATAERSASRADDWSLGLARWTTAAATDPVDPPV
ncbi:MAG TPA: hypothetical protein PKO09_12795 [Anaerolineae bacterium]|nr:hypothetical protein [Anaerolineae bacterium]